jgi:hypothetical protein
MMLKPDPTSMNAQRGADKIKAREFVIYGVVQPERGAAHMPHREIVLQGSIEGRAFLSIIYSQVTMSLTANKVAIPDERLPFYFQGLIGMFVSALGYDFGCAYQFDLIGIAEVNIKHQIQGVDYPEATKPTSHDGRLGQVIFQRALQHRNAMFLARSIRDVNSAVRAADDSGFYCYRAIESTMQFFRLTDSISEKKPAWESMRNALGVEEEIIRRIQQKAKTIRQW